MRRGRPSVSAIVRRKRAIIARRAVHHCAQLQISLVDRPAVKSATIAIAKREEPALATADEMFAKLHHDGMALIADIGKLHFPGLPAAVQFAKAATETEEGRRTYQIIKGGSLPAKAANDGIVTPALKELHAKAAAIRADNPKITAEQAFVAAVRGPGGNALYAQHTHQKAAAVHALRTA